MQCVVRCRTAVPPQNMGQPEGLYQPATLIKHVSVESSIGVTPTKSMFRMVVPNDARETS